MTAGRGVARWGWLAIVLALGGPVLAVTLTHTVLLDLSYLQRREISCLLMWVFTAAVVWLSWRREGRPLSALGLGRLTPWGVVIGVLAGGAAILSFPLCALLLQALGVHAEAEAGAGAALVALPLWARIMTLITAGVCEETLYRGYPIVRLRELTGSRTLSVLLPGVVFVAVHAPTWSLAHLPFVAVVTVVMTMLFLWRRDLYSNIIAHLVTDAIPLLLLPALAHH